MGHALTIPDVDDAVWQSLQAQAAMHGRSVEAEANEILTRDVAPAAAVASMPAAPPISQQGRFAHLVGIWKGRMSTDELMRITRGKA